MDIVPKVQGVQTTAWWLACGGESHGFLDLLLRDQNGMGEEGFPKAGNWRETGARHCWGALAMVKSIWWWPRNMRLDWHLSPGQGNEKERPPCTGGCTTRPVGGSRASGRSGKWAQAPPLPLQFTPASLRLKHSEEEMLSGVCAGTQVHRTVAGAPPPSQQVL